MSREAENEYFSDGITEELIHALAQIEGLRVAGRTSSFFFKGKKLTLKDIGRQLQVAYVVDGSVRNINDRMLISVQLVSVDDGSTLWSRIYDPARGNLLSVQQDMASTIADTLAVLLGVRITPPLVRRVATNDASYHRYLKGRYFFNQRSAEGLAKALDYFEEAILLDPDNALAHASIVHAYAPLIAVGSVDFNGVQPRLKRAVEAALALDSTLSEVYTALISLSSGNGWPLKRPCKRRSRTTPMMPQRTNGTGCISDEWGEKTPMSGSASVPWHSIRSPPS